MIDGNVSTALFSSISSEVIMRTISFSFEAHRTPFEFELKIRIAKNGAHNNQSENQQAKVGQPTSRARKPEMKQEPGSQADQDDESLGERHVP